MVVFYEVVIKPFPNRKRNIPGILSECSLSVEIFRVSREHLRNMLKENILKQILDGIVVFVLKVSHVIVKWQISKITKQCFQNIRKIFQEFMFQKYSKDITGIL